MVDQLDINESLGPLFTIKVVHYADAISSSINPPFAVVVEKPIKQMFSLVVGAKTQNSIVSPQNNSQLTHIQTNAAATWIINHSLGRIPHVQFYHSNGEAFSTDFVATSATVTVTFPLPTMGIAVLI